MFGGLKGLEASLESDEKLTANDPSLVFDYYVNTCPGQGSGTIMTEEAILVTMSALRPVIAKATLWKSVSDTRYFIKLPVHRNGKQVTPTTQPLTTASSKMFSTNVIIKCTKLDQIQMVTLDGTLKAASVSLFKNAQKIPLGKKVNHKNALFVLVHAINSFRKLCHCYWKSIIMSSILFVIV